MISGTLRVNAKKCHTGMSREFEKKTIYFGFFNIFLGFSFKTKIQIENSFQGKKM